ncbi:MAG: hypothetical protein ABIO72_05610 [Patescibacteria group bacterium]
MSQFESIPEQKRGEEPLFQNIEIPDLSPLTKGEHHREKQVKTILNVGNVAYPTMCTFERFTEQEVQPFSFPTQKAKLGVEVYSPSTERLVASFKGALNAGQQFEKNPVRDKNVHLFWHIFTRRVEKETSRKGDGRRELTCV